MFLKGKEYIKELNVYSFLGQLSFDRLGPIGDPLMVSKFHNRIHDPKGRQVNKSAL